MGMAIGAKRQASQCYTWTFPICPHDVAIDLPVVRTLAELAVADGPQQGLLLGTRERGLTRIAAFEPLAALDAAGIADRMATIRRPVVGYYRIREGCAFILDPAEIHIAKSLFSEPGSVVLLIERRPSGGAEGAFAFWRGEAFVSNLPRPFPFDAVVLAAQPPQPLREPEPDPLLPEPRPSILNWNAAALGLVACTILGASILPLIWSTAAPRAERAVNLPAPPMPPPAISTVSHSAGDIQIAWDPRDLSTATAGLLRIADGDLRHYVALSLSQLRHGSIVFTPARGAVSAELKVLLVNGRMVEIPVSDSPASLPTPAPPALPSRPVVRVSAVAAARPGRVPARSQPPVFVHQAVAGRFELASPVSLAPEAVGALPEAPVVQVAPRTDPVLTASLPPPPPPSRVRLGPAVDRAVRAGSGRLIWTGSLERRGVIEFEGRSASVGSITGGLPGVPVNVTVSPAEFGSDGLEVYTTDARLNHHVEPPSASNGWNRVTYIWDPQRVRQIAVLETPNASNRFSHLALRSDARRLSLLVIDWHAQTPAAP
jgi:hypothetical protein